jgi:hypothetical protein
MIHGNYVDGQTTAQKLDKDRVVLIRLSTVGSMPSKVSATWTVAGGKTGIAYGGFQDRKDFDFQAAASAAVENAVAQAKAV